MRRGVKRQLRDINQCIVRDGLRRVTLHESGATYKAYYKNDYALNNYITPIVKDTAEEVSVNHWCAHQC
jgi:hypothetical protein